LLQPRTLPILVIGLLFLASAGRVGAETAPAAGLPEGVVSLPPEGAKHFDELLEAAEKYRGLKALRPIPAGWLEEAELHEKIVEDVAKGLTPDELQAIEIGAKAFGLIPDSMDLSRYLPELLTSQVAGFYDPEREYMALVRRGGRTSDEEAEETEEGLSEEDVVIVHELTHALQDQHFDLEEFEQVDPLSDAATARAALTEGDATLAMTSFLFGRNAEEIPRIGDRMRSFQTDSAELASAASDLPGGAEFARAPAWIQDTLLFSYVHGFSFCLEVRQRGGQKLLDHAFTADPPRSSEQILHPWKWHSRRDDPVALHWPDLSPALPGWARVSAGEMGEASIRTLLRNSFRKREKVEEAAAGWGGDRFAVYEKDGRRVLVWWTEWDSEADARQFRAAARKLGAGWHVETLAPRRVQVVRGELTPEQRAAVRVRLAAALAAPPALTPKL
jgi:hypothetical protein